MPVYNYINETGVVTVDGSEIEQQVQAEYRTIFGVDLVVTPNTPQGMLISAETLARIAVAENNAKLANQMNPNVAGGVFLDSTMALTNPFNRLPAFQSSVFVTVSGIPGTVIPAGSLASETGSGDNNQFFTPDALTIPASGSLTNMVFLSVAYGPIPCAVNSLTSIVTPVLGWENITNVTAAVLGRLRQSDSAARLYRLNTLATQGASTAQAITSEVMRIGSVSSVSFLENTENTTEIIDDITMVAKSIYVCVADSSVADLGTRSEVEAVLTGTPATLIPAGSEASSNGYVFRTLEDVTIPGGGSISGVLFQAVNTGQIPVPVNSLTTIVTPVVGWSTVNNTVVANIGLPSPIAQAIVAKKSAGAAYNNGLGTPIQTIVNVPYSGQLMTVKFDVALNVPILVFVTVKILTSIQNATEAVQDALVTYAQGGIDGIAGLTVGQAVSAFELAGAITTLHPGIYVQSLFISKSPTPPTSSVELAIGKYEIATLNAANIIVNVVQ